MLLGERTHRAVGRHVRVQDHADELPVVLGTLGALPERRGERVVDDPHVRAVRRDRGGRVVAAVALLGDVGQIGPRVTAVRRGAEQDALVVQRLLLRGGEHDLIRRVLAARCAVGDVDGRVRHEVVAGTPHAVHDAPPDRVLDVLTAVLHREQVDRSLPGGPAVDGPDHLDRALGRSGRAERELIDEHVDGPLRIGAHRAPRTAEPMRAVDVVRRGRHLLLRPGVATVRRCHDVERLGG
jgi:hypothetical protein